MNRGKLVIVTILVVGISLAGFAWWNRWSRSQQVIAHWGPTAPTTIRVGKTAELLLLAAEPPTADTGLGVVKIHDHTYHITQIMDISQAKGLIHARHQLVQNEAFDWDTPRDANCRPRWSQAIRFRLEQDVTTIAFDFPCQRAMMLEQDKDVGMQPIATGMQSFLNSVVDEGQPNPAVTQPSSQESSP